MALLVRLLRKATIAVVSFLMLVTGLTPAYGLPRTDIYTDVGLLGLTVTNLGYTGNGFDSPSPSGEYPIFSNVEHLFLGGLWVGAETLDGRRLVSTGAQDASTLSAGEEVREYGDYPADVEPVHVWSNRPLWPQGMLRPPGRDPVPKTLDWDLWIGPAQMRPFVSEWQDGDMALKQVKASRKPPRAVYHPWNFRGWWDFGTGALGDMGCHHFNHVFKALKLRYPTGISASASMVFEETAPLASIVTF